MEKEKVYFKPGDVVQLRQRDLIDYAPRMLVIDMDNRRFIPDSKGKLRGVRCCWFSKDMEIQEAVFSTKDLELVELNKE